MFPAMGTAATILWIRTSAMDGETIKYLAFTNAGK